MVGTINVGTSTWSILQGSDGRLAINDQPNGAGAERFNISTNGNVGVGTTSVNSRLTVQSSGNTSATSAFTLQNSNGTSLLTVLDDGSMGIGTSTFSSRLVVQGIAGSSNPLWWPHLPARVCLRFHRLVM